ncbi:MAG TPA: ADP-ribosylglycohydrolase family protein [Candidatus Eisenbacteria bacterium]|nr:ADP-ribosylglycohydrolase family protein [Candidatus Eisenbacteria bacterium]
MKRLVTMLDAPSSAPSAALADRYRGAMLGLAAGNALGLPVEGFLRPYITRLHPGGVRDVAPEERTRSWDDDLAQAVVLAEAIVERDRFEIGDLAARFLAWRRENGRGIGHHTWRVLDAIERGTPAEDAARAVWIETGQNAAGNGAVMRCAPVALRWRSEPDRLIEETHQSALVTHHDARCGWSAVAVNAAIAASLDGRALELEDLAASLDEAGAPLTVVEAVRAVAGSGLDALELDHDNTMGYTLKAMKAALWALEQPGDFETIVMTVVNAGGDADTNGAVVGAALGAKHGVSAIPARWVENIRGTDAIAALADRLYRKSAG